MALGVFATVVAINLFQLSLMAQDRDAFLLWHGDIGATATNVLITMSALAWAAFDVRDELFR